MKFFEEKEKNRQFYLSYCAFVINGMLALSIGSLLPFIRDARALEYAFCGLLVSLHSVGNLVASFTAGALPLLIGRKKSILFFNAFSSIAYLLILAGGSNFLLALAFFMTGLARGAASNYCNMKINSLAPGKAWIINGLHAMFSIGAFIFPILLTLLTAKNAASWTYACIFMLVMSILGWILYLLIPEGQDGASPGMGNGGRHEKRLLSNASPGQEGRRTCDTAEQGSRSESCGLPEQENGVSGMGFFKEPLFYICTATLFFYLCAEQGVIGWMITYFKDTGLLNASLSQITASVLWIMILMGRLTAAWLSTKIKKEKLLVFMGVGLVAFFILLILSRSTGWIMAGIMGFGYSMAGIYPTTVSFTGNIIQKYPLAWSFILTLASLGSIIMPSVIGRIAESAGIFYGMSSIGAVLLIDLACIVGLAVYVGRMEKRTQANGEG